MAQVWQEEAAEEEEGEEEEANGAVTAAVAAVAAVAAAAVAAVAGQAAQAAQVDDCIDATEQPAAPAHLPEACEEQGPNALSGAAAAAEEAEAQERLLRPHAGTPERRPSFGSRLRRAFAALVVLPDPQEEEEEAHGPELQLTRTHSGAECAICLATLGSCVETPCGSTARLWALRPSPSLINAVWPSRCLDLSPSRTPSPPSFPPLPSPAAAATPSMPPASSTTLQPRASPDNGLAARTVAPRCTRPCRSRRRTQPRYRRASEPSRKPRRNLLSAGARRLRLAAGACRCATPRRPVPL